MANVSGSLFDSITESTLMVDEILSSPYPYEQQLVKIVHGNTVLDARSPMDVLSHPDRIIKIEGYERLNRTLFQTCKDLAEIMQHDGPVTCHLFKSPAESVSFPVHTDPDDVYLYMVEGSKHLILDKVVHRLERWDSLLIPRDTPHKAVNFKSSLMLSFGLERFIAEKL
ncbi:hypothetical protein D3C81_144650 [compost metagenome]